MKKTTETDIRRACLEFLSIRGILAWKNNSGAFAFGEGKGRRFFRAGVVGGSDILGVLPGSGRLLAVETKSAAGRLTEAQGAFLDSVRAAGGLALVVRDVKQLEAALRLEGIL